MRLTLVCFSLIMVVVATVSANTISVLIKWNQVDKTATFDVHLSDTVLSLKQKIRDKFDIPVENQWLVHENDVFQNDQTLAKYHLENKAEIILLASPPCRPRSGGASIGCQVRH